MDGSSTTMSSADFAVVPEDPSGVEGAASSGAPELDSIRAIVVCPLGPAWIAVDPEPMIPAATVLEAVQSNSRLWFLACFV